MKIAIGGGKGGTGKTTVAVNVAVALQRRGHAVQLADCDVEEPNAHLLLHPTITARDDVQVPIPQIDHARCDLCGRCVKLCAFGALVQLKDEVAVFPELCHSCGGCTFVCPHDAVSEVMRTVGYVETGLAGELQFVSGTLNVGEPRAVPVIAAVKERLERSRLAVLDVPPGTSCPVVEALGGIDFTVLVAEPTPFGLHDLTLAVDALSELDVPLGIVINRSTIGDARVQAFAAQRNLCVLGEIPDSREAAVQQARGKLLYDECAALRPAFDQLAEQLEEQVNACRS